jgi:hypothetical protein
LTASALANLTGFSAAPFLTCDLANASICEPLEAATETTVVLVYNSQAQHKGSLPVRIPVGLPTGVTSYAVTGSDGSTPVTAQLLPASQADLDLRTNYYNASADVTVAWLAWLADVPPAGFAVYFVTPAASQQLAPRTALSTPRRALGGADTELSNGVLTLTISATTGLLAAYRNELTGIDAPLLQEWCWYNASAGNNVDDSQVRVSSVSIATRRSILYPQWVISRMSAAILRGRSSRPFAGERRLYLSPKLVHLLADRYGASCCYGGSRACRFRGTPGALSCRLLQQGTVLL